MTGAQGQVCLETGLGTWKARGFPAPASWTSSDIALAIDTTTLSDRLRVIVALKSVGWQWRKTRRTDPARVERHWLVLSAPPPLTPVFCSRAEVANALKRNPSAPRSQPKAPPA